MFREATLVSHSKLKTDWTNYRKRFHAGLTLLNIVDSSTKGFLEVISGVLAAQERSLSLMYGRPDESCGSFTLMYFG